MKKLADFTEDQLKDLYKKHKLRPLAGNAQVCEGRVCAIGVILVDAGKPYDSNGDDTYETLLRDVNIEVDDATPFYTGFDRGFDGASMSPAREHMPIHQNGHRLGQAMKAALLAGEFGT